MSVVFGLCSVFFISFANYPNVHDTMGRNENKNWGVFLIQDILFLLYFGNFRCPPHVKCFRKCKTLAVFGAV